MADDVNFFEQPDEIVEGSASAVRDKIANFVKDVRRLEIEIEDLEAEVRIRKAAKDELELKKIPDALLEAGLSEITTLEGLKVSTKFFVGAIPREKKPEVFDWMDRNGHSSLIKRQVAISFDKGSSAAAAQAVEAIKSLGLEPKETLDVHHMTWSSFAKEQVNHGKTLPFEAWGVFVGQRATIKG